MKTPAAAARPVKMAFVSALPGNRYGRLLERSTPSVSYCRVDAAGVPAEWVEVTTATPDQMTVLYFRVGPAPSTAVDAARPVAAELAKATGGRVLSVGCRGESLPPSSSAVDDGLAAFAWLLGEGCDPALTVFVANRETAALAHTVFQAARDSGLPIPVGGVQDETATTPRPEW